jgi:hypothetical protein
MGFETHKIRPIQQAVFGNSPYLTSRTASLGAQQKRRDGAYREYKSLPNAIATRISSNDAPQQTAAVIK